MSRLGWMALGVVLVAASAGCGYPDFIFDGAGGGGGGGGGAPSKVPSSCAEADDSIGCCGPDDVLYYCAPSEPPTAKPCTGGLVCGWDDFDGYYDCVLPPGGSDPLGYFPITCGP
jgi:hypothetical protein